MVYKKYINRNGKLYGPYEYHSKRVDGKVITEYHGAQKSNKLRTVLLLIGVLIIVFALVFILGNSKKENSFTGQSVLNLNADYKTGEILNGKLEITLNKGELIPADSKIIFENSGNIYDFNLKDIVTEEITQGDFYIEGKEISGSGEGYGEEGNPIIYPNVSFKLNIYSEEESEEIIEEEITTETSAEETEGNTTETPIEEPLETQTETTQENTEITTETVVEESTEEVVTESPAEEVLTENAPITGNAVGRFFRLTGKATLELKKEIEGIVSKDKEFTYQLREGESAEIEPLSVRTSSINLDDNDVKLKIQDGLVTVTTDYSGKGEKGFGSEFLEDGIHKISINLEDLNLSLEKGDLDVKIIYQDKDILSLKALLEEEIIVQEPVEEKPIDEEIVIPNNLINKTINESNNNNSANITNQTLILPTNNENLTMQEKATLLSAFGNTSVSVVKSELFKDRIIIGYKLGNYEIEYSYDSSLNKDILENEMEKDRIKWLKDIVKNLLEEESAHEQINLSNNSYEF